RPVQLRRDDDLIARREVAQRPSEHFLTRAERVHVGGVEEIDAKLERATDERAPLLFREDPRAPLRIAVRHRAQTDARDLQTSPTKIHVRHWCMVAARYRLP